MASLFALTAATMGLLAAVAWVLEPLVRPDASLEPLRRPGPDVDDDRDDRDSPRSCERCCLNCGTSVDKPYSYCSQCVTPVP